MTVFQRPDPTMIVLQRLAENAHDVDALFVLAVLRVMDGNVPEGLTILDQVLRLDPRYPGAWRFKASLHGQQGETAAEASARQMADDVEP
jgi:hypothetical protein